MFRFLPKSGFKWIDPKDCDSNKYSSNSLKRCIIEVDLEYPKELPKLHNDFPLPPDKIEISKEMLPNYQLRIVSFYNIPIGSVKKLVTKYFDKIVGAS